MDYLRSDSILREILEEKKSLTGFLDAVFGFMSRNTDFFHIQKTKDDKLGFPRGVKEQILMSCLQKYEKEFEGPVFKRDLIIDDPPLAIEEIEVVADSIELQNEDKTLSIGNDVEMLESLKDVGSIDKCVKFNESDYKNGAKFENYCWSQTLKDVELNVVLPSEVKSGKHVKMDLKVNQISIKTLSPKEEVLICGQTWDKYRHNDVVWTIADGKLLLSFDKFKDCWWDKLFIEEPSSVDIKKLDIERPIEEYSPATQSAIEKVQCGNSQPNELKTLPLSQSEQMSRLRKAWNAEGSPFKGQPFDPSSINFS